ncbi:MAG: bifunctional metallophosphatase/5'-nucleotidase [bacterium]
MSLSMARRRPLPALVRRALCVVATCVLAVAGQALAQPDGATKPVRVTLVHLNDIYEIGAVEGGKYGGLARVATVFAELRRAQPPVLTTLGGDYLSPSALGTARIDGKPLAGRQMVEVLNASGLDWATFGNHEFDVSEAAFRARLAESKFRLVSSNVTDVKGEPFAGVPTSAVVPVEAGGRTVRLGLVGVTIPATKNEWVRYRDPILAARAEVDRLAGQVDAIVALTHLSLAGDTELVTKVPEIDVVLGGHEHENWELRRGPRLVPIIKADANVRTLAVVTLEIGAPGTRPEVSSRLRVIDDAVPSAPAVEEVVKKWTATAFEAFRKDGFSPESVVTTTTEPLDGRESTVRNAPGRLTQILVAGMAREAKDADVALLNGGSVRIDDVVPAGPITEYDVIRILPFGGRVVKAVFEGELLARVLDAGDHNQGLGGYLHTWGVRHDERGWLVGDEAIDPQARYRVALPAFLLTGGEINLGFLKRDNPQVHEIEELRDVRQIAIDELRATYPTKP